MTEQTAKILLADDDPITLEAVGECLTAQGYEVTAVSSGDAALASAKEERPDLAVLDIRMPGMDGIETAARLQALGVETVFLTAYGDMDTAQRAITQGALGFLVKPVQERQLQLAVCTALTKAKELRKLRHTGMVTRGQDPREQYELGMAIGIYMERFGIPERMAEDMLRAAADKAGAHVAALARDISRRR